MLPNSNTASASPFRSKSADSTPFKEDFYKDKNNKILLDTKNAFGVFFKRSTDIAVSLILIVLFLPIMILVTSVILIQRDGGSVFYGQKRICRSGKDFFCYKFRSMCPDASERLQHLLENDPEARAEWAATHKLHNDPRITPVGRFLRSTSLDELPQLWNVLRGDMSLVGPRPVTKVELEGPYVEFGGRSDYLSVRPGLTGLWQVSGRSLLGYKERVMLDRQYVRTASVMNDLRILLRTVSVVFRRHGAH